MRLLFFGMVTSGYTIIVAFTYWIIASRCGMQFPSSAQCAHAARVDGLLVVCVALAIYVLGSMLFWGWRPFRKNNDV